MFDCRDKDNHSLLVSGITVSNLKVVNNLVEKGTLGFFARMKNVPDPENVVLVSNHHVLCHGNAVAGDRVYSIKLNENDNISVINGEKKGTVAIGYIHKGFLGNDDQNFFIDCASAKLDFCISSWCNSHCGVDFVNKIRDLNFEEDVGLEPIKGVAQAKKGDIVYKVGRLTGWTKGEVEKPNFTAQITLPDGTTVSANNILLIKPLQTEPTDSSKTCDNDGLMAGPSDSGAALVNSDHELVGMIIGGPPTKKAYACHIDPVLKKLEIEVITEANPHPAEKTISDMLGVITGGEINDMPLLREKFLQTDKGREIFDLVMKYRHEVADLVNHNRPVTVAWHRNKGPLFLSHFINNARDPSHLIPYEIEGINRVILLDKMVQVLSVQGSSELKTDIERYLGDVLFYMNRFDNLHELVEQFEPMKQNG